MALGFKFKHYLFNAFRELFIYHHGSLEFRAKIFALVIAANKEAGDCEYETVKTIGMKIYNEEDRANTLVLTTRELVEKIQARSVNVDHLVQEIAHDIRILPRYSQKIDTESLELLRSCHDDADTLAYQRHIIDFLRQLRDDYIRKP